MEDYPFGPGGHSHILLTITEDFQGVLDSASLSLLAFELQKGLQLVSCGVGMYGGSGIYGTHDKLVQSS